MCTSIGPARVSCRIRDGFPAKTWDVTQCLLLSVLSKFSSKTTPERKCNDTLLKTHYCTTKIRAIDCIECFPFPIRIQQQQQRRNKEGKNADDAACFARMTNRFCCDDPPTLKTTRHHFVPTSSHGHLMNWFCVIMYTTYSLPVNYLVKFLLLLLTKQILLP